MIYCDPSRFPRKEKREICSVALPRNALGVLRNAPASWTAAVLSFHYPQNRKPSTKAGAFLIICHPEPAKSLGQRPIGIYLERRSRKIRGAHASRVLVAASRRDELLAFVADLGVFLKKSAGSSLWRDAKASTRDACAPQNRALSALNALFFEILGRCPTAIKLSLEDLVTRARSQAPAWECSIPGGSSLLPGLQKHSAPERNGRLEPPRQGRSQAGAWERDREFLNLMPMGRCPRLVCGWAVGPERRQAMPGSCPTINAALWPPASLSMTAFGAQSSLVRSVCKLVGNGKEVPLLSQPDAPPSHKLGFLERRVRDGIERRYAKNPRISALPAV